MADPFNPEETSDDARRRRIVGDWIRPILLPLVASLVVALGSIFLGSARLNERLEAEQRDKARLEERTEAMQIDVIQLRIDMAAVKADVGIVKSMLERERRSASSTRPDAGLPAYTTSPETGG